MRGGQETDSATLPALQAMLYTGWYIYLGTCDTGRAGYKWCHVTWIASYAHAGWYIRVPSMCDVLIMSRVGETKDSCCIRIQREIWALIKIISKLQYLLLLCSGFFNFMNMVSDLKVKKDQAPEECGAHSRGYHPRHCCPPSPLAGPPCLCARCPPHP